MRPSRGTTLGIKHTITIMSSRDTEGYHYRVLFQYEGAELHYRDMPKEAAYEQARVLRECIDKERKQELLETKYTRVALAREVASTRKRKATDYHESDYPIRMEIPAFLDGYRNG